ncbi:unnamed protein product [Taenia asiatica]|uniref:Fibronectin type-III domain-containing protein n=1 Tax=Taenia asiatica TaxID=60517 RepID=A0A0R3W062_TAEAS|nr:unnamed protein product [Taenia asiatica]
MARISWEAPIRSEDFIAGYRVSWTFDNRKQNHSDLTLYNDSILIDVIPSETLSANVCTLVEKGSSDISGGREYLGACSNEVKITTSALEEGEPLMLVLP